jgi:hypothetical protein
MVTGKSSGRRESPLIISVYEPIVGERTNRLKAATPGAPRFEQLDEVAEKLLEKFSCGALLTGVIPMLTVKLYGVSDRSGVPRMSTIFTKRGGESVVMSFFSNILEKEAQEFDANVYAGPTTSRTAGALHKDSPPYETLSIPMLLANVGFSDLGTRLPLIKKLLLVKLIGTGCGGSSHKIVQELTHVAAHPVTVGLQRSPTVL